ncbi:MAG TPA: alpha/beta hydrolase [Pseudomonadales bacterium]
MTQCLSRSSIAAALCCALATLAGCDAAEHDHALAMQHVQVRKGDLVSEFGPCPRDGDTPFPGLVASSRCAVFSRPENPDAPEGRQVDLQVMVVPAIRPLPEPDPFVILVGGPGQAATVDAMQVVPAFERIRRDRDILLVDQRGTGRLSPLDCDFGEDESLQAESELLLEEQTRLLQACLDAIDADPRYYTTDIAVQDLDAIRDWLGYRALNLWGVSYGTRVALMYLKYFPDTTRTVVIDGVAPPGVLPLEAARDGKRALQQVLDLCREETACSAAFPQLHAHYAELRARYAEPVHVELRDPNDGTVTDIELRSAYIDGMLFQMLYSREATRLIPLFIEQLHAGNLQPLTWVNDTTAGVNVAMHYSVICSEDVPLLSDTDLTAAATDEDVLVYDFLVLPRVEGCKLWPSRALPDDFFTPVSSDRPVLIFSGTQDPVTPRRWGDRVAETLPNSLHLVASGVGHGVFAYGCASDLIGEFVSTAEFPKATDCIERLDTRPFFTTFGGSGATE